MYQQEEQKEQRSEQQNNRLDVCYSGAADYLPIYASCQAAGADLRAAIAAPLAIMPGQRVKVATGIRLALPQGYEAQVRPRSGLAWKHGIGMVNGVGTIDADYRGEICVLLINHGDEKYIIQPKERIAQLVIAAVVQANFNWVKKLDESERGGDGFGSTWQD